MRHISGFRLFLLAALTATSLIVERAGDAIAGSIVVGDDVNTFGTILAGSNEAKFAVNVANFLTAGHATKNLLLFEATPGDGTRDFSPVILNALTVLDFLSQLPRITRCHSPVLMRSLQSRSSRLSLFSITVHLSIT